MFILVDADFTVSLQEPLDFKGFKLVSRHPRTALAQVAAALQTAAAKTDIDHSWIREAWLRQQASVASDAAWQQSFNDVVAYARKKGWVDEASEAIRAHVEWQEPV